MSELSLDNIIPETQEDEQCSVTKNNDNKSENDLSLNESQDFRLVADDETQKDDTIGDNDLIKATPNDDEHEADAKAAGEARDSDKDKTTVEPESTTNDVEKESKIDDDEDEIVESSQTESSTKRKQLVVGSAKRKAEDEADVEPSTKLQRTSSREDALDAERKKIESSEEAEKLEKIVEKAEPSSSDEPDSKTEEKSDEAIVESSTNDAEEATDDKMEVDEEVSSQQPSESAAKSSASPSKPSEAASKSSESPSKPSESPSKPVESSPKPSASANSSETSPKSSEAAKTVETSPKPSESSEPRAIDENEDEKMEVDSTAPSTANEPAKTGKEPEKQETTSKKSRMSIEVIYDKALAPPPKPKELVEIDEDGEKIILDSSQEDTPHVDTSYKTCENKSTTDSYKSAKSAESGENPLTNGSEPKPAEADATLSMSAETIEASAAAANDAKTAVKPPEVLNLASDSEGDSFVTDDKAKAKIIPIEKEMNVIVKIKCLLQVNEATKEITGKEFLTVDFENLSDLHLSRRRNSDASALADVSDNKDPTSPGSVTSQPQPYPLNPSRLSLMSSASTSSSSSSGSSKIAKDNTHFSLPRGIPKHAKRIPENLEEATDKLKKEWKSANLLTAGILTFVNSEILSCDLHNGTTEQDTLGRLMSSTPETQKVTTTPKSSKKGRVAKRSRQNSRSSRTNGIAKISPTVLASMQEVKADLESNNDSLVSSEVSTPSRQSSRTLSILRNQTPVYDPSEALVGKNCFAKWSDNNYYPGKVLSKSKGKFKVNFLDGKNKLLIEDFVIPMLTPLGEGLSVYATTPTDGYGSCGIITAVEKVKDEFLYVVETDDGDKIKVPIKDIFMSADQVQSLREMVASDVKTPPSTPSMGKVTMDNIVEGNRRTKSTSAVSTPKRGKGRSDSKSSEPSSSGVASKVKREDSASDSNFSVVESDLEGVQAELVETPNDLAPKGPASRVKGKGRNRKKSEDQETIATLGPIPEAGSSLFKGMSFILTCAPLESLDRYKAEKKESANSETETENEAEWNSIPFARERLTAQLVAGGGTVYEEFKDIPEDEYQNTKLITNVPNVTAKSLLCLAANIHPVNHRWVIRCCRENKLVNVSEESLPAGWSFDKNSYVDTFQRPNQKPLGHAVIVMPKIPAIERSIEFWQRVVTNAGGVARVIENQSETFMEGTVVLAYAKCPSWIKEKAAEYKIPLVSTTWLIQSLIEGKMMPYDAHPLYQHNPAKK